MSGGSAPEADRLATRLHFAAVHLLRRLRRADEKLGLSTPQLSVLSTLVNTGAMTMSELAAAEQVRPPTMTRLVQRLVADGYLLRETSESDARVQRVRHTSKAWLALQDAARGRAAALTHGFEALTPAELDTLASATELIERLAANPPRN